MATPSGALSAWLDSVKDALKAAISNPADDLHEIKAEKDPARQIKFCETFLKTHSALKKECQLVEEFLAAAKKEWGVAQAKKAYLLQAQGKHDEEFNPNNKFGLKHLTDQSKAAVSGDLADASGHGMDEAEVAAIKTFTAADYQYLNPAVANQKDKAKKDEKDQSKDWMDTYKPKPGGAKTQEQIDQEWPEKKKELYQEGALHAGVMMEGLKKMQARGEKVYRGFRISPTEFKSKFRVGATLEPSETFQSTSMDAKKAWEFSQGNNKTLPDQTVAVILEAQLFDGRDIMELSVADASEKEILTLPGTLYKVEAIEDMAADKQYNRPTGAPRATEWKTVKAIQIFK